MPCNNGVVDSPKPESELRSVISDGLSRLDRSQGGRYMSTIARRLGVDRSTVSRWRQHQATARPDHCEELARNWPSFFDLDHLLDLHYRSLQIDPVNSRRTAGVETFFDTASLLRAATVDILVDPPIATDRVIRLAAFHLEQVGTDALTTDRLFAGEPAERLVALRESITERAQQGWDVKVVISAGNSERLASINGMVRAIDGPEVEIFAYPFRVPLVIAPLIIANRTVIFTYDHRRWELPGSAMIVRSRTAADWASRYFDELISDAPFQLRRPSGIDQSELDRFAQAMDQRPY